jgi:hypothetical protein
MSVLFADLLPEVDLHALIIIAAIHSTVGEREREREREIETQKDVQKMLLTLLLWVAGAKIAHFLMN